jgi:hypothetical protein
MYILTHKTYLEEKNYKIIIFVWNNRPVNITRSNRSASKLEFHIVMLQNNNYLPRVGITTFSKYHVFEVW